MCKFPMCEFLRKVTNEDVICILLHTLVQPSPSARLRARIEKCAPQNHRFSFFACNNHCQVVQLCEAPHSSVSFHLLDTFINNCSKTHRTAVLFLQALKYWDRKGRKGQAGRQRLTHIAVRAVKDVWGGGWDIAGRTSQTVGRRKNLKGGDAGLLWMCEQSPIGPGPWGGMMQDTHCRTAASAEG